MSRLTPYFGFLVIEPGDDPYQQGHKFFAADRDLMDWGLFWAISGHHHDGATATADAPVDPPALTLDSSPSSGGTIPASTRLWYTYTEVSQSTGLESVAAPSVFIDTPDPVVPPDRPILAWGSTGGTLLPGQYSYVLSAWADAETNETNAPNTVAIIVPVGTITNRVVLTLPSLPANADGFNIYRRKPGGVNYDFIGSVDMSVATPPVEFVDDGLLEDCDRIAPKTNLTNSTNSVQIDYPGGVVPVGFTWKIYRTINQDDWTASLLHHVVEETAELSGIITPTYLDLGYRTGTGAPLVNSPILTNPEKVLLTGGAEVQGILPLSMIEGGGGGGTFNVLVAGVDAPAAAVAAADYVCDGTNDEVEFNDAIADLPDDGGVIELVGRFSLQAQALLTGKYNVVFRGAGLSFGDGPNCLIRRTGGTDSLLNLDDASVFFENVSLRDDDTAARTDPLILMANSAIAEFERCDLYNAQASSSIITATDGGRIAIRGSIINSPTSGGIISSPDGGTSIYLTDNVMNATAAHWVASDDTSGSFSPSPKVIISNCHSSTNTAVPSGGIANIVGPSSPIVVEISDCMMPVYTDICILADSARVSIKGNTLGRPAPSATLGLTAIKLDTCTDAFVEGNHIRHAGHHGIWLLDSADCHVTGNRIAHVSRVTNATYSGILLDGNSDRNHVQGNTLRRASSGNQPLYGIRVDDATCNDNYVHANDLHSASATSGNEIADLGTGTRGAEVIMYALGDETTVITTGTKLAVRMPFAFILTRVRASLTTVSSSGIPTFDINESASTVLSTKLTVDASEKTSTTAATAAVISDPLLADDAEITFDIDVAGTGATGPKIALIGYRL